MLLYDSKRQLVAIDEKILEVTGFESTKDLFNRVDDIAELFVNRPGYVYKFQNFSWIDYVLYNPAKTHLAIIETNRGGIEVKIEIHTLVSKSGDIAFFCVDLIPEQFSEEFGDFHTPQSSIAAFPAQMSLENETTVDSIEAMATLEPQEFDKDESSLLETEDIFGTKIEPAPIQEEKIELLSEDEDEHFHILSNEDLIHATAPKPSPAESETRIDKDEQPILHPSMEEHYTLLDEEAEKTQKEEEHIELVPSPKDKTFQAYNIHNIANELEIDEALLKELIDEFIEQAYELRLEIYKSIQNYDFEKLSQLLHKIRGAANNLRIREAAQYLQYTKDDEDIEKITEQIDNFYAFLDKFAQQFNPAIYKKFNEPEVLHENTQQNLLTREESKNEEVASTVQKSIEAQNLTIEDDDVDLEIAIAAADLGLDKEEVQQFIEEYIQEVIRQEATLYNLLKSNTEEFKKNIHKLKGTAANLRLQKIEKLLAKLMQEENIDSMKQLLIDFFDRVATIGKKLGMNISKLIVKINADTLGLDIETYKELLTDFYNEFQDLHNHPHNEALNKLKRLQKIAKQLYLPSIEYQIEQMIQTQSISPEKIDHIRTQIHSLLKDEQ
ncbi:MULTISPECIES: Hpt domain-containing protein [unclassified Nitratiruptor]|uniref:Hpt domain-containing protein n=1 Tax=unclassified Nitratiruptor TaxID=2624044 RepID=UPI0019153EF6|nr:MULTISPECIES: hypothetical protein [unclassified Nitratiruptor]BCD60652.1 hypothetical protein NitYY0810_C1428 [Nitratiruptor sp. YY08-10]BCD64583.1 hypothetical protein NitYY0814_C1435 [Nitratiruptor sp. YY08-14]